MGSAAAVATKAASYTLSDFSDMSNNSVIDNPLVLDIIHLDDCVEALKGLPANCVDLVFADPPYNLQLRQALHRPNLSAVDAVDDHWDQFASFQDYDRFTHAWLQECRRVLKDTGTLWVIGSYHNIFRVGTILQDLGYWILNDVIWVKANPMPNFRGKRFCNAHETLIWAAKSQMSTGMKFNYHAMKVENGGVQMRSDWYFPICSGAERLRDAAGDGSKVHSTQKPEALLERIIRASSHPGDVVLDPFFGSGTTGAVARRLGRHYVGIEREPEYIRAAAARIAAVQPMHEDTLDYPSAKVKRLPFATLLEMGLLHPGDKLRLGNRNIYAVVTANATLESGGESGSIHLTGARLLGAPACNGWEHWQYLDADAGKYRPLDVLRQRVRAKLAWSEVPVEVRREQPVNLYNDDLFGDAHDR